MFSPDLSLAGCLIQSCYDGQRAALVQMINDINDVLGQGYWDVPLTALQLRVAAVNTTGKILCIWSEQTEKS